ncbi:MAG: helix-turn-helix transcriptional regulator [Coriobacteriales bacterium]|nr:helix-turn-helix transcriptional regulator [Coriobacteriales bacterium]
MTEELLEQLMASATPEAYLNRARADGDLVARDLSGYLHELLNKKELTRADVIRASGLNTTFVYQIFEGSRGVSRGTALLLAFGLGCTVKETQRLLTHAGFSQLYSRNRRDAIILFCLEHGYTRVQCDDELYRLGEVPLLDDKSEG